MPCPNEARVRSKTMAFRCTPEEYELIGRMAGVCGMSKQEYIMAKLTDTEITVVSSPRTRKAMKEWIDSLSENLQRGLHAGLLGDSPQEQLTIVLKYFNALCAAEEVESKADAATQEEPKAASAKMAGGSIFDMERR